MRTKTLLTLIALTAILTMALPALGQGQAGTTLSAEKTATGYWEREFEWTINKSVTPATWDLFTGDSGTSQYTITVTKDAGTDTYWVKGQVCVTNGGAVATKNLTIYDHVQYKVGAGQFQELGASQTITPDQLAPGATGCYDYSISFTPVAGAVYRNVATITITNHSGHLGVPFGPEPKAGFSLPASPTLINDSIHVDDTDGGSWEFSDSGSVSYDVTFACDADKGTHDNTATIRETGQSDDTSVTVNCYTPTVSKTAVTLFTRTYNWTIDKVGDQTALTLSTGQTLAVNYNVTVNATYTDSDWLVGGVISVTNPHPTKALTVDVTDMVSPDIAAWVDCDFGTEGNQSSLTVPAGGTGACNYGASLPDAAQRTNTATATLQNYSYDKDGVGTKSGTTDFTGTADVIFPATPTTEIDECITVTDDKAGSLGVVCYGDQPVTFTYSLDVGPYDVCGEYEFVNTASFVTNDTGATGSDSWTVIVHVPCAGGCTLTPGYWKTHSIYGPARWPDDAWYLLSALGPDTPFFSSGQTWYQVLWTPPTGGNAYYILAHAYIAAKLNVLNGADPTAISGTLMHAEDLLSANTPSTKLSRQTRADFIATAGVLNNYNNGYIGPGHCDE